MHCELNGAPRFTGPDELDCRLHRLLKCDDAVVKSCKDGSQTLQPARLDSNQTYDLRNVAPFYFFRESLSIKEGFKHRNYVICEKDFVRPYFQISSTKH